MKGSEDQPSGAVQSQVLLFFGRLPTLVFTT